MREGHIVTAGPAGDSVAVVAVNRARPPAKPRTRAARLVLERVGVPPAAPPGHHWSVR